MASQPGVAQPVPAAPLVPRFDPGAFRDASVTNPFFPLEPGAVYVYAIREGTRTSVDSITVTREKKRVGGVAVVVVHDRVRRAGKIVEDTRDWYAQDTAGKKQRRGKRNSRRMSLDLASDKAAPRRGMVRSGTGRRSLQGA